MSHPTPDFFHVWNVQLVDISKIPFAPFSFYLPALVKAAAESTPIVLPHGLAGSFTLKAMTEGTTNHLFKATGMTSTGQTLVRMIKIYGDGTDITIDRRKELALHEMLSDHGLSSDLVLRFGNGHIYTFVSGDVCSTHEIHNPESYTATAKEIARWHATLPLAYFDNVWEALDVQPGIWATMQRWIEAIPASAAAWPEDFTKHDVKYGFRYLFNKLVCGRGGGAPEPMVLGHGDLLCGNIILNRAPTPFMIRRTVYDEVELGCKARFIDYEHATYVPRAFELANHFSEWAGFECDYTKLPSRGQRRQFIAEYLLEYTVALKRDVHPDMPDPSDPFYRPNRPDSNDLESLMREVDLFRGLPGFYWGVCAILQAETATGAIDFDYKAYALKRMTEYAHWRYFEDTGDVPDASWAPAREIWWNRD